MQQPYLFIVERRDHRHESRANHRAVSELQWIMQPLLETSEIVARGSYFARYGSGRASCGGAASQGFGDRSEASFGGSYGKVGEVLNDSLGLQVCRNGWCRTDRKLA